MPITLCNVPGCPFFGAYCRLHRVASPEKEPAKIAHVAANRKGEVRDYNKEAKEYKLLNPYCVIKSPVCTGKTQGVNHKKGRKKYLNDKSTWEPACNPCNDYCEEHPEWAIENGHKESRHEPNYKRNKL